MTNSKTNYCAPDGRCTRPAHVPESACAHGVLYESMGRGCLYQVPLEARCLSPFALTDARNQPAPKQPAVARKNYRNADGACTAANYDEEAACTHYEQGPANGICVKRAWCDVCCSADAAKEAVA